MQCTSSIYSSREALEFEPKHSHCDTSLSVDKTPLGLLKVTEAL